MLQKVHPGASSAQRRRRIHLDHSQHAYERYAAEARLMTVEAMNARDNGFLDAASYFQREAAECAVLARAWAAALTDAMEGSSDA